MNYTPQERCEKIISYVLFFELKNFLEQLEDIMHPLMEEPNDLL